MNANEIFTILSKEFIHPQTELKYVNSFTFAIAVLLSAQSTDKQVNKITESLFQEASDAKSFLQINNLEDKIKSIGLYKTKAKNIILLCKRLEQEFNGEIPNNLEDLISLPGIGRKSANVILNTIFNHNTIAVDTHVNRVAKRLKLAKDNDSVLEVEQQLNNKIPNEWKKDAHNYLILHGRYICTAKNPKCHQCPLSNICPSKLG